MKITFKQIGTIHTPFTEKENIPIQSKISTAKGNVIIFEDFADGLYRLEEFSHIYLIYYFHKAKESKLILKPFLSEEDKGIFAVRAPLRPNHIGLSIVELKQVNGNIISFKNADMLDGTPLLDIKPYVPKFDIYPEAKKGWLPEKDIEGTKSDNRFS